MAPRELAPAADDRGAARQSRGLGDTVARALERLGLRRLKGCGCARRQERLNRWFPYRRRAVANESPTTTLPQDAAALRFRFPYGLGDAVQLTSVLLHLGELRPHWTVDIACRRGADSLFAGLCRRTVLLDRVDDDCRSRYAVDRTLPWGEPDATYADSPSTKAEQCLREVFQIPPVERLCRYSIETDEDSRARAETHLREICGRHDARYPAVVLHYQGNSARGGKNLDEEIARRLVAVVRRRGLLPLVLDFESPPRSQLVREGLAHCPGREHPLWQGLRTGDGATLAALFARVALVVAIDSGPGHVAGATDTPTAIVWRRHHPVNYYALAENVTHLVDVDQGRYICGDRETGEAYFRRRYRYVEADAHYRSFLPVWLDATLRRVV